MKKDFEKILNGYLNGVCSSAERAGLAEIVRSDPKAMRIFIKHVRLHSLLREIETESQEASMPLSDRENIKCSLVVEFWKPIAACLILGLTVLAVVVFRKGEENPAGTVSVTTTDDTVVREEKRIPITTESRTLTNDVVEAQKINEKLEKQVSLQIAGAPLSDVIALLREKSGLTIVIDKKTIPEGFDMSTRITLEVKNMEMENVLFWTARQANLVYTIAEKGKPASHEILLGSANSLTDHARLHEPEDEEPDWRKSITEKMSKKLSFSFANTPLRDVGKFLSSAMNITIMIDPAVENSSLTMTVKDMSFETALKWICQLSEIDYTIAREAILIHRPGF